MAIQLSSGDIVQFHHHRNFCWTRLLWSKDWQNFSLRGKMVNIWLFMPDRCHCNHLILLLSSKSSYRKYINNCVWLCFNKVLFIQRSGGPDLACGQNLLTLLEPWFLFLKHFLFILLYFSDLSFLSIFIITIVDYCKKSHQSPLLVSCSSLYPSPQNCSFIIHWGPIIICQCM